MAVGTVPLKFATGVKVKLPSLLIRSVPTPAMVAVSSALNVFPSMVKSTTVTLPSALEVPVSTLSDNDVSSSTLNDSLASVKSSLTGVTVMLSVEVSLVPLPSVVV